MSRMLQLYRHCVAGIYAKMAATDQKVPGNRPAIAMIATITTRSGSIPVHRSARNVPQVSALERLRSEMISYMTSTVQKLDMRAQEISYRLD